MRESDERAIPVLKMIWTKDQSALINGAISINAGGLGASSYSRAPTVSAIRISYMEQFRGTTIVSVRRDGKVAIAGDGQVSMGNTVMKGNARKVRTLADGRVIAGFAGGTADAFTLFELFESKLEQYGNLTRAAIELAKDWRTDRRLRRLEALLCVADQESSFVVTGNGDVIEPEHDLMAIGSGGPYAQAAALALLRNTDLGAREIAERALKIAGEICVFTNQNIAIEELPGADS